MVMILDTKGFGKYFTVGLLLNRLISNWIPLTFQIQVFTSGSKPSWILTLFFHNTTILIYSDHNSMFECCSAKYESYQIATSNKSALGIWLF